MTQKTYQVPLFKKNQVVKKLETLNKRARNLDINQIVYTVSDPYQKEVVVISETNLIDYKKFIMEFVDFYVENTIISLKGWSFLAVIDATSAGNIVLKLRDDVDIPERYNEVNTFCEHCEIDRFRKKLFLVYNEETKETIQVGSTCIGNYLGFDASMLLFHATLTQTLHTYNNDEPLLNDKHTEPVVSLNEFLKYTIDHIKSNGYVSGKQAYEQGIQGGRATGREVLLDMLDPEGVEEISDDLYKDEIEKIREWVKTLDLHNNYYKNVAILFEIGYVTYKRANLAASVIVSHRRSIPKVEDSPKTVSQHFGKVKERIDVILLLTNVYYFEGDFGTVFIHKFITPEGNCATWFTSREYEIGISYVGKATIKKHDEYKGTKQTILTRCSIKEVE